MVARKSSGLLHSNCNNVLSLLLCLTAGRTVALVRSWGHLVEIDLDDPAFPMTTVAADVEPIGLAFDPDEDTIFYAAYGNREIGKVSRTTKGEHKHVISLADIKKGFRR